MTAAPPARDPCTTEQMKKLFACARERGLSVDEVRAMTPNGSVKAMTWGQCSAVINRILGQREDARPPRRGRRGSALSKRRPPDVFAPLTDDQRDTIDRRYRIAMGWTPPAMLAYLKNKTYPSDPSRTMDSIISSADGVAVTEHLKKVLFRTLAYHAKKLGRDGPDPSGAASIDAIKRMMTTLPPHPALSSLLQVRLTELRAAGGDVSEPWLAEQKLPDGRLLVHVAFCSDAAELIYRVEHKLRQLQPRKGRLAPIGTAPGIPPSVPPCLHASVPDRETTYNIADYRRPQS